MNPGSQGTYDKLNKIREVIETIPKFESVKFVCTLVCSDCVPFCKYIKIYVNPGSQGTYDKLNQIREVIETLLKFGTG